MYIPQINKVKDQDEIIQFISAYNFSTVVSIPTWNYRAIHAYGKLRLFKENELLEFVTSQLNK